MNNALETLKRDAILAQNRKKAEQVDPAQLQPTDEMMIIHQDEKVILVECLYDGLESSKYSTERKKSILNLLKHLGEVSL